MRASVLLKAGLFSLLFFVAIGFGLNTVKASAHTATPASLTTFAAADLCPKHTLLGIFVPWYQYLPLEVDSTGSCAVKDFKILPGGGKSDFPLILLAIVDDMLRLAGLAAVIFVIYGGIMYATSQGEPESVSRAKSTILNALIGLVVALVAIVFVTYVGKALGA
jgi:hypothetical protein